MVLITNFESLVDLKIYSETTVYKIFNHKDEMIR